LNIILINLNYVECWDDEPDNRPTIYQIVDLLKAMIIKTDVMIKNSLLLNEQKINEISLSPNNSESRGELTKLIQNFNNIVVLNEQEKLSSEKDFVIIVDKINDLIFKLYNKGIERKLVGEQVIEYLNNYNISSQDIYDWLSNNKNNSNSIFLLGYFNYRGIETSMSDEETFNLFIYASEKNHILAQSFVAECYKNGYGTIKNEKLAFKYFKIVANENFTHGQLYFGYCYEYGIGINKDFKKAFYWYEKASNNGNIIAMQSLGIFYKYGMGVEKNHNKAFELIKQSAEEGNLLGITSLGNCYHDSIGTEIDYQKAFELFQKTANLGDMIAQHNLGNMYENGRGTTKDIDKAIYWYEKSAEQGYINAQNRLTLSLFKKFYLLNS
jgi:TPR repeat protein